MAGTKGFKQLKYSDRLKLEALLKAKVKKAEIARILHVHPSTIYNELKRGQYEHLNSDYTTEMRYSPDIAQARCDENMKVRGTQLKIGKDIEYANYIESKIVDEGYSPEAVIGELKAKGMEGNFKTTVCVSTVYSYIDKGVFLRLTNKDLPVKQNQKRPYHKVKRQKRANAGESIENRPPEILNRDELGHWEMDSVIGNKHSQTTLLVLTERKTRYEIVFKLKDHTAGEVVKHIDILERKWGDMFPTVFKTITVDNGSEFAFCEEMEKSCEGDGQRTKMYYCHPYSSWERGSNENANKLIRRKIPKGSNFDDKTDEEIQEVEDWINSYPRGILDFHTSKEFFEAEIEELLKKTA